MAVKRLFSMYALGTNVAQNKIFWCFSLPLPHCGSVTAGECKGLFLLQQRCNMLFCMRAPELLPTTHNCSGCWGSGWKDVSWQRLRLPVPSASAKQMRAWRITPFQEGGTVSGLVVCAVVAAVSQSPALLEGQKLPKYYLLWQNTSAVSSCRERHSPVSECPHCPQSCHLKAPLCKPRATSLGCFSVCRNDSHAHLLPFPCSFGSELGRGRNWHGAELVFPGLCN